ncbi:MAG: TldD/PmbA family protein [Dehalococcoidia bacterium]|jgi:predicted Zn-dependent protease
MLPDETELKNISDRMLSMSRADQTEVLLFATRSALTRFANSYIHQNVEETGVEVSVRAVIGKKIGVAGTNMLSDEPLRAVVERASMLAAHQKENEDFRSLPGPEPVQRIDAWVERTASFSPDDRAEVVAAICDAARNAGVTAAGAFRTSDNAVAVANSLGIFAYHRETHADINTTMMADGSGYADRLSPDAGEIDGKALAAEAIDKCLRSAEPISLEPGEYDVILEDYATSDILDYLAYLGFGAQPYQEQRSFMSGRLGERVVGENVSIWDDGLSPETVPMPFDFEGVPKRRVELITDGVAKGVVYDSYYGGKEGKPSTGHALPAGLTYGPMPSNLFLKAGEATIDDMLASTERGIWVSRFWYTRPVHPLKLIVTGMTRDGTFLIEKGRITAPIKNLRFTQGYLDALSRVEMIGRETRLRQGMIGVSRVPALKVQGWTFSGATEF